MTRPLHDRARKRLGEALVWVGATAYKGLLWVCCGPLILCVFCCLRPGRRGCVVKRKPYNCRRRPKAPGPRLRSLTLPLVENNGHQKTFDQSQSTFMAKLPLEIRHRIYKEILGGATIELRLYDGKLDTRWCRRSIDLNRSEPDLQLAMLSTCRQIYSEAIEFLYSNNTLVLTACEEDYPILDHLSCCVQPHRLTKIQHLSVFWEVDSTHYKRTLSIGSGVLHFEAWMESWSALRAMTGLRQLRIVLYFRDSSGYKAYWERYQQELLEPVKFVTAPNDFVLVLPDRRCSVDVDLRPSQCVLQLPA